MLVDTFFQHMTGQDIHSFRYFIVLPSIGALSLKILCHLFVVTISWATVPY